MLHPLGNSGEGGRTPSPDQLHTLDGQGRGTDRFLAPPSVQRRRSPLSEALSGDRERPDEAGARPAPPRPAPPAAPASPAMP